MALRRLLARLFPTTAAKKDYRHFKIKTVEGPNDYASMEEIVYRRYKRLKEEKQPFPDLIIVDGGKGQLSSAAKSLKALDLIEEIPIVGIAKRLEEIYYLNDPIPLHIDKRSTSLKVIQHLRNEAHHFANSFNAELRSKRLRESILEDFKGLGEVKRMALLKHFGSLEKLRKADAEAICQVEGIGPKTAERLVEFLGQSSD